MNNLKKTFSSKRFASSVTIFTLLISFVLCFNVSLTGQNNAQSGFTAQASAYSYTITNPYNGIDWTSTPQLKANLHTHSTESDGSLQPADMIKQYYNRGYSILAMTDHNHITYPWNRTDRTGKTYLTNDEYNTITAQMCPIKGDEETFGENHVNSFFCDYQCPIGGSVTTEQVLNGIQQAGGISQINHPGMYGYYNSPAVCIARYQTYPSLFGLEVINERDKYPNDRDLWDQILSQTMPTRPVWGTANDDAHQTSHVGNQYETFLLQQANENTVRDAMTNGKFYFSARLCKEDGRIYNSNHKSSNNKQYYC